MMAKRLPPISKERLPPPLESTTDDDLATTVQNPPPGHRESYQAAQRLVTSDDTIHVKLAPGGGACVLLRPIP